MNEKKGVYVSAKEIIAFALVLALVFWVVLEIFKIKHTMNFATTIEQVNRNTVWIQNFSQSIANAQQQQRAVQQRPVQPKKVPEKK